MHKTPYLYNGDRNALPTRWLRAFVEYDCVIEEYIARCEGNIDIAIATDLQETPDEAAEKLLCALESLGFDGFVELQNPDGVYVKDGFYRLGKTRNFKDFADLVDGPDYESEA